MLDCLDLVTIGADGRAELSRDPVGNRGRKQGFFFSMFLYKGDAGIARGRAECELNRLTRMQAYAGTGYSGSNSLLISHVASPLTMRDVLKAIEVPTCCIASTHWITSIKFKQFIKMAVLKTQHLWLSGRISLEAIPV